MTTQNAVLWYKVLLNELGSAAHKKTAGELAKAVNRRKDSLVNLFFSIIQELSLNEIMEIGSNNAETSRRFVSLDNRCHALAYEASPVVYHDVRARGLPERFNFVNNAVGAETGDITFFIPNDPRFSYWGSTLKRKGFENVREISVPVVTLDTAAANLHYNHSIRDVCLWVDVEGSVFDVLKSGVDTLKDRIYVMYLEMYDINVYENSATAISTISFLLENGFIPIARDNEYIDAWNLVAVHHTYFDVPREAITRWSYAELAAIRDELVLPQSTT